MDFEEIGSMDEKMKVLILTENFRITGEVMLMQGSRLTDFLANSKPFIAVTDAEVLDREGRVALFASFLNVHRDHIELIAPIDLIS
jgi:hypothetical protein